jgi:hypothetical protein
VRAHSLRSHARACTHPHTHSLSLSLYLSISLPGTHTHTLTTDTPTLHPQGVDPANIDKVEALVLDKLREQAAAGFTPSAIGARD